MPSRFAHEVAATARSGARRLLRAVVGRRARALDAAELRRAAIVFAPHPDDETLGCGGTIRLKRRAGARVRIVHLTDGARSHAALMPPAELAQVRAAEARAAAAALGVAEADTLFCGFPDGALAEHEAEAADRIAALLAAEPAEEVYVPSPLEPPSDHSATYRVVRAALERTGAPRPRVYEYPVWFWAHWPWIPVAESEMDRTQYLRAAARAGFGLRLLARFRRVVDIGEVHAEKQAALGCYRSQTTRLRDVPDWATLGDVARGEWLDCLVQRYELFGLRPDAGG